VSKSFLPVCNIDEKSVDIQPQEKLEKWWHEAQPL
jgi:hypothetical protein